MSADALLALVAAIACAWAIAERRRARNAITAVEAAMTMFGRAVNAKAASRALSECEERNDRLSAEVAISRGEARAAAEAANVAAISKVAELADARAETAELVARARADRAALLRCYRLADDGTVTFRPVVDLLAAHLEEWPDGQG